MSDKKEKIAFDIAISVMALVVFLYRFVVLAIPMFTNGIRDKNYRDIALSFTMLV